MAEQSGGSSVAAEIGAVASSVEKRFQRGRRVLSFSEYLDLFASDPVRYARDASRYLRDAFDHYGTVPVEQPWGRFTRWKLFDLPWDPALAHHALIGQEQVQEEIYRSVSNFVREGRPNRLVLLHGPNGSAKSTIVGCVMRGLENYSTLDEGALYRFNWVFPSSKTAQAARSASARRSADDGSRSRTYAHLPDDQIDAKLLVEVRDHPLFLLPMDGPAGASSNGSPRTRAGRTARTPPDWILRGRALPQEPAVVFEALLASYQAARTARSSSTCRSSATSSRSATAPGPSRSARR